MIERSFEGITC